MGLRKSAQISDMDEFRQVGTRCDPVTEPSGLLWNQTDGGIVAMAACPRGYQGSVYRPCYMSGLWGTSDLTDCRLERLANIRNLVSRTSLQVSS